MTCGDKISQRPLSASHSAHFFEVTVITEGTQTSLLSYLDCNSNNISTKQFQYMWSVMNVWTLGLTLYPQPQLLTYSGTASKIKTKNTCGCGAGLAGP